MKQHPVTEGEKVVVALIALCGNEIVGRTRFQKQAYLLDRCGADFGFRFMPPLRPLLFRSRRRMDRCQRRRADNH